MGVDAQIRKQKPVIIYRVHNGLARIGSQTDKPEQEWIGRQEAR